MRHNIKHQEKLVREWNEKYPVGTPVIVTMDDGTEINPSGLRGREVPFRKGGDESYPHSQ